MLKSISKNENHLMLKIINVSQINYNLLNLKKQNKQLFFNLLNSNFFILTSSIIKIKFKNSNVFITITDYLNNLIFFSSVKPKLKKIKMLKLDEIYKIIYQILFQNKNFLKQSSLTLQIFNNNDLNLNTVYYFVEQISNNFNLTKIQFFKNYSFNGCKKEMAEWLKAVNCKFIDNYSSQVQILLSLFFSKYNTAAVYLFWE